MSLRTPTLVLGWGNPGRADDGLGPALVSELEALALSGVETMSAYQLQIEHAADVARYRCVVFVDADRGGPEPYALESLAATPRCVTFSTHSVPPATVLALARDLFAAEPEAWLLGIRGYEFDEFREQLSDRARFNLQQAVSHLALTLGDRDPQAIAPPVVETTNANHCEGDPCQTTDP
jgi:hydrogenase maturation protease